jgi:hypothetical protein
MSTPHSGPSALFRASPLDTIGKGGGRVFLTVAYSTPELSTIGFLRALPLCPANHVNPHSGPSALSRASPLDTIGKGGGRVFLTVAYSTPELSTIGFLRAQRPSEVCPQQGLNT